MGFENAGSDTSTGLRVPGLILCCLVSCSGCLEYDKLTSFMNYCILLPTMDLPMKRPWNHKFPGILIDAQLPSSTHPLVQKTTVLHRLQNLLISVSRTLRRRP